MTANARSGYWAAFGIGILPLAGAVIIGGILAFVFAMPTKWDGATVLRICRDGTPILRLQDGSIVARRSALVAYRVEDFNTVCETKGRP